MAIVADDTAPDAVERVATHAEIGAAAQLLFLADPLMQGIEQMAAIDRRHRWNCIIERHLLPIIRCRWPRGHRRQIGAQIPVVRQRARLVATEQQILVGACEAAAGECARRGRAAVHSVDDQDAVAGGECAGAASVPGDHGRRAGGGTAVDHQPVRRRAITSEVGVQADLSPFAYVVVDRQRLVARQERRITHGGQEVYDTGVVYKSGDVGVPGHVPGAVDQREV